MGKQWLFLIAVLFLVNRSNLARAEPLFQDDATAQCAEGVRLMFESEITKALPLLEAGFANREGAGIEPNSLGQCGLMLGLVRQELGDPNGALEAYRVALASFQSGGNREAEGIALNSIASVYALQRQPQEALATYEQALAISREVKSRTLEGKTLLDMGLVYQNQANFSQALAAYEQALILQREVENRDGEGIIFNNLGAIYEAQGRYEAALLAFEQALAINREQVDQFGESSTLNNIGEVYRLQGRLPEAQENFEKALAVNREIKNKSGEGNSLNSLGTLYEAQGRYEEALENFELARALWQEVENKVGEGGAVNNIAGVYQEQGRYAEALEVYQQALLIRREAGDRIGEGITFNNIGEVYRLQRQDSQALKHYRQALEILQEVGDQTGEGSVLSNIGSVYEAQGRRAEALESYFEAINVLETVRTTAGSEAARSSFIARFASLYASTIELLYQEGRDEEAFFVSERGRARAFLDSLATGQVQLRDNTAADLLARESALYAQRQLIQDELAQARSLGASDHVAQLETQRAQLSAAYDQILAAIQTRSDQLVSLIPGRSRNVLGVPEIQALLNEESTLISFYLLDHRVLAFLITQDSFQTVALDINVEALSDTIQNFRDFADTTEAQPQSALTLYKWLIQPLRDKLTTPHLVIVPHGALHYLPFAALTDGDHYLMDDYLLTTLPSGSTLPFIQRETRERPAETLLILGDPATGAEKLPPLLSARKEARAIAALYGASPLLDTAATEQTIWAQAAAADILHLAAHGRYNPANPLYSALYLTPSAEGEETPRDGRLEVHEIYELNLEKAALVVLSACETQVGKLSAGDEVVGLTRAFFFAGAPSVIASLWNVEDETTALLMERFYTYLKAGRGKAQALRQAQLEVREAYPNPYYWAGFVLSGDPGESR